MSIKTVVVIEHFWDDSPRTLNKDLSVLPFIDGVCRLGDFELFYGQYANAAGFKGWFERFQHVLQQKDRRIILYLAGHGSNRTLGDKKLVTVLRYIYNAANHLNIEGCILGGCFVGRNIYDIQRHMISSNLTWMIGYKYSVDWLSSTLIDMNIIYNTLSCCEDELYDRQSIENIVGQGLAIFDPNSILSADKKDKPMNLSQAITCVIQPKGQGNRPLEFKLFS